MHVQTLKLICFEVNLPFFFLSGDVNVIKSECVTMTLTSEATAVS